ncbi:MAG: tRNA (adenosine(37)-N6)-dimethylallyltransferase MiaA [Cyanobacteria bacterium J06648_11]
MGVNRAVACLDSSNLLSPTVPGLIAICGPTASGKSSLALRLAIQFQLPLLGADSRQIYRYFDIGTAKPTPADRAQWPHQLVDIADPTETVTVSQYQALAREAIAQAHQDHLSPILVGGTGLYVQAIACGLSIPPVPPHPQLRQQLANLSQPFCYAMLRQVDPAGARAIHANDSVRTSRSLEVYYVTGKPQSELQRRQPPPYPVLAIGLRCRDLNFLEARIRQRTNAMLASGWLDEVKQIQARLGADLPLLQTLGYAELSAYLRGEWTFEQTRDRIVKHTRQFAKRQMTWFKRTPGIRWFDCEAPDLYEQVEPLVGDFLARASGEH